MAMPGFRAAWKLSRGQFGMEFRDFCDAIVSEMAQAAPRADAHTEWNKLVAKGAPVA